MYNIRLTIDGKPYEGKLPSAYSEMNERQFVAAVAYASGLMGEQELLRKLLGKNFRMIDFPQWVMLDIRPRLEYIRQMREGCSCLHLREVSFLLGRTYYAPADSLAGMSLQQFMSVDNFFSFYCFAHDESMLHRMLACLYLRKHRTFVKKSAKDVLVDIGEEEAYIAHHFPDEVKLAIFVDWILTKNWLSRLYKYLFSGGGGDGSTQKGGTDWLTVFDSFVGDHVAEMEKYQAMECMDAFRIMNNKIKEARKK